MTTTIDAPRAVPAEPPQPASPAERFPDRLEVVVNLEDIARGECNEATACAVALALVRAGYAAPSVALGHVNIYATGPYFGRRPIARYRAPGDCMQWIRAFDSDPHSVSPERFVLQRRRGDWPSQGREHP